MKKIRIIFLLRMICWSIALGASIYWIKWSFKLYELGFVDDHDYAVHFRPIFAKGLLISVAAIGVSLILRYVSDKLKKKYDVTFHH